MAVGMAVSDAIIPGVLVGVVGLTGSPQPANASAASQRETNHWKEGLLPVAIACQSYSIKYKTQAAICYTCAS